MVTNNYTPYASGVVHSIQATRQALMLAGHAVTIATLDFIDAPHEEGVIRIKSPLRGMYRGNPVAMPWRPTHVLRTLIAELRPTIIHSHHPFLLGMAALKAARSCGIPIVFTHHTRYDRFVHHVPVPQPLSVPIVQMLVARYCRMVDAIVAPSAYIAQMIEAGGVDHSRVFTIPSPLHESAPTYIPKSRGRVLELITVGRFSPEKNTEAIIEALAFLKSDYPEITWHMTIVGYGPQEQGLRSQAYEHCGLSPHQLTFVVKPARDILKKLYQNAHIFLFASQSDAQGLVLAEALAAGLPIVALECPIVNEAVLDGKNGLFAKNARQMADLIALCASNVSAYAAMSRSAAASAGRYGLEAHQQALLALYDSLI